MNPYLVPVLEFGPTILQRLVSKVENGRLDEPTGPGRFSAKEAIAHLADWEPILLARMHQAIEEPGSSVEAFDEGEMAISHGYNQSDIEEQLRLFASRRRTTAEYLRNIKEEDWTKTIVHPERGTLSVVEQANMLLGHDLYHIEQISGLLEEKSVSTW